MHDMQEAAFKLTIVADMKWLALDRQLHLYRGYQHQRYEECPPIRRPGNEKKDSVFNKMLDGFGNPQVITGGMMTRDGER